MARQKRAIDNKALLKMVKDGAPQKEIMEKFGIKTSPQFKVAYLNAAMESGMVPEVRGGRAAKEKGPVSREVSVGKRGSLVIPKAVVNDLGLKEGDTFWARKTKSGVSLLPSNAEISEESAPSIITKTRKKQEKQDM
jgi:AbrB family looped-hinge helix DNA binding protein